MKKLFLFILIISLGYGGWWGYANVWAKPAKVTYRTAEVSLGDVVSTVSATGTVQPVEQVLVGSEVSGTVTSWSADFNQPVKVGDVLLQLDQDRFKRILDQRTAAVTVAKANVQQAEARHANALRQRRRMERLRGLENASEDELAAAVAVEQEMLASVHASMAQVLVVEAEQRAAEIDLQKTTIRSPIDGVVILRAIDKGQTVAASLQAPELFTIAADLTRMRVHANVSETDIGRVREGMNAEFTVDAYPGRAFHGQVSQVRYNPTDVDTIVTYETLIDVENADHALRPGMTATIAFEIARADDVMLVPNAALRYTPGGGGPGGPVFGRPPGGGGGGAPGGGAGRPMPKVYTLVNNKPVPIEVKVGLTDGSRSQINAETLADGATVVVEEIVPAGAERPRFTRAMR
jgi:HlyD family secretion protein